MTQKRFKVGDVVRCKQGHIHPIVKVENSYEKYRIGNMCAISGGLVEFDFISEQIDGPLRLCCKLEKLFYGV